MSWVQTTRNAVNQKKKSKTIDLTTSCSSTNKTPETDKENIWNAINSLKEDMSMLKNIIFI